MTQAELFLNAQRELAALRAALDRANKEHGAIADTIPLDEWAVGGERLSVAVARIVAERDALRAQLAARDEENAKLRAQLEEYEHMGPGPAVYELTQQIRARDVTIAALREALAPIAEKARLYGEQAFVPGAVMRHAARVYAATASMEPVTFPESRCACGLHMIADGIHGVRWYWAVHARDACALELPNEPCWCGRLRSEHQNQDGHDPTAPVLTAPEGKP